MKKYIMKNALCIPLILWIVIIPIVVKEKLYTNPLSKYSWYSNEAYLADFFLYYKSMLITITGVLMVIMLFWQINKTRKKDTFHNTDTKIFIPVTVYLALAILSSLFSEYGYFCVHGMPDQFETIWNTIAYVTALLYCYYLIAYRDSVVPVLGLVFIGATLVGLICILQYFRFDIYRMIYAGEGYTFTFAEGVVYGPFYNINYVGYYTLLLVPLFIFLLLLFPNIMVKIASAFLATLLIISMIGADSITAEFAIIVVAVFAIVFIFLKNMKNNKLRCFSVVIFLVSGICICIVAIPRISAYIHSSDTEKTNLENIYTHEDNVEIDYKGQKLFIQMQMDEDDILSFTLRDQKQTDINMGFEYSDEGYYYYTILDERFPGMTITPALISEDPEIYGFMVLVEDKSWCFTNQMTDDGTYYYYTDLGKITKLKEENVSEDFAPLVNVSSLANGRGYIWNKTIALLNKYVFLGSGADTYALVFPNNDFVDKYNNGYDNLIITKPHNMYLQIAVQTGVLSLICFLVFYGWYFISSIQIYFKQRLDNLLTISGFSIMLGTLGYMISGLANDSTVTISPLYWALMGVGIGINHRLKIPLKK